MARKRPLVEELEWESDPRTVALRRRLEKSEAAGLGVDRDRAVIDLRAEVGTLKNLNKALHERLAKEEKSRKTLLGLKGTKATNFLTPRAVKGKGNATACAVLSDWHVEEVVKKETVNDLNEHNLEISANRIGRTAHGALKLLDDSRNLADVRTMVVALLGDFITGYIHDELVESNSLAPLPATRFAKAHILATLDLLLAKADLDSITVVTAVGNHGRTTPKMRYSTSADNSFEYDLYCDLEHHYRSERRIRWQNSESYHNWLDIQGHPFRFSHGDAIRYSGGIGGITIPIVKAIAQWDLAKRAYVDVMGHLHQRLYHPKFIVNSSLIGYGAYSLRIKAGFEPPTQTFFVVDRDRGLTRVLPIFCDAAI